MTDRDKDKADAPEDRKDPGRQDSGTKPSGSEVGPPNDQRVDDESDGKSTRRQE